MIIYDYICIFNGVITYVNIHIYTRLYTNTPKCWNKNRSHAKGIHPRNVNGMSHFLDHGGVVTLGVPKKKTRVSTGGATCFSLGQLGLFLEHKPT